MTTATGSTERAIRGVRAALAGRRLVWCGIRGEDGEALTQLPELAGAFSISAPLRSTSDTPFEVDVCLEAIRGSRPDLDRYDVDADPSEPAREFRRLLLREVGEPCVVMPYRPSNLVSALAFAMEETMTLAGLVSDRQALFEHKPWVERSLRARGVAGLGWRYVADEHRAQVRRMVAVRPHVLRVNRASGGVGIVLANSDEDVECSWPEQSDAFIAVAPFLAGVPINLSGCVFADGSVRLHPPSVQLIGINSCIDRPFGYCGNDFGAAARLGDDVLDRADALGRAIGSWLYEERYLGAFGVDAIVAGGDVVFTEVNARFQGSSAVSALVARELDVPDLFLDHLGAMLGLGPTAPGLSICAWARRQPAISRVVVHNTAGATLVASGEPAPEPPGACVSQLTGELPAEPGATLGCLTLRRSVTTTGFDVDAGTAGLVETLRGQFIARS